jgi:predicted dehydrogenase
MKIYRAAIVGCGRMGSLFSKDPLRKGIVTHAAAYKNIRSVRLVAACDLDDSRLKEFGITWGIKSLYTDVKEMLSEKRIDVLSICTPPSTHNAVLKDAVKYPIKAIFCEKPLAENVKDAEEMVKLCEEKNIILQIDHQRRFDPMHINLKKLINDKKLGSPQQVNFYYTAGVKNTGSHMFDILRFFFGDVEWVEAFISKNNSWKEGDPNLDGILKFKDGTIATFQGCDFKKYLIFEMNCFLDKGRVVLKDSGFSMKLYGAEASKNFSGYNELLEIKPPFKTKYKRNFLFNAVKDLLECIKNERGSSSSGRDGLAVMKIIEAILSSAKEKGRRVWIN